MLNPSRTLQVPGYRVIRLLGSGARSTIWQARNRQSGEEFALKRVLRRDSSDQRFLDQVTNEFHVAQHLDHPVIRKIYRLRKIRKFLRVSELHLFMELCAGASLQDRRPTLIRDVMHIFTRVAEAVAYMNTTGWVHADLKPNNILVAEDGTVKIIDLGQSCRVGTIKQRIQGTPDFIAPEQFHRRPLDARTDVFNFGAALYWTLTGQAIKTVIPQRSNVIHLMSDLELKPINEVNPAAPPALASLVADCVAFQPAKRPTSMQPVQTKLELIQRQLRRQTADELPGEPPQG